MADAQSDSYLSLTDATTTATGSTLTVGSDNKTVQITGTTTAGAGAVSVAVEVTNDTTWPWIPIGTLSLTLGTTATTDGLAIHAGWKNIRARVTSISGTGAKVSASVGV